MKIDDKNAFGDGVAGASEHDAATTIVRRIRP